MRLEIRSPRFSWIAEAESWLQPASWPSGGLPLTTRAVQSEWSGAVMELFDGTPLAVDPRAQPVPFQYPGLLAFDPQEQRYAICYGEGRWQDGFGPLSVIPVARITSGLDQLREFGNSLQFIGAQPVTVGPADGEAGQDDGIDEGRPIEFELAGHVARAVLLERSSPHTTTALATLLPLFGTATNTYASGPLTRFWNNAGGGEGATPLEEPDADSNTTDPAQGLKHDPRCTLATPGQVYYMTSRPWCGLRIAARQATVMKSALPGGDRSSLVPIAKLVGDWTEFRDAAANLKFTGALPMTIRLSD